MKVPFLDLGATYREQKNDLDKAYFRVMESGHYIMGPELKQFEEEFATYCGTTYGVGVSNGLDALVLLLEAYGISNGDEVIVPSNTFIATWLAVSSVGAIPISVAPASGTFNIDPGRLRSAITKKTKAIIPVHLYGIPCDMDPINSFAKEHGLIVIEDAAQAHGAIYNARKCGNLGHSAAFSFYPGKNLGAYGDAGAITTNDKDIYDKVMHLRNYGSAVKYVHKYQGHNFRLDEIQAAFLRVRLLTIDSWNLKRQLIASFYDAHLSMTPLQLPKVSKEKVSSWHLYVVSTPHRDELRNFLEARQITTLIHYPVPPAKQDAYSDQSSFVEKEPYEDEGLLSLPIGPHVEMEAPALICRAISEFFSQR